MITKELKDIAWNVPESEYRADPALSYSTLSSYESLGFDGLSHLYDKKESPSLLFGSAVDAILTGGYEEFNNRFSVVDINVTQGGLDVINYLVSLQLPYNTFNDIPSEVVSQAAQEVGFWKDAKWNSKRYDKVLATGNVSECYNAMIHSDKQILSTQCYNEVLAVVNALRTSEATARYFNDDDEFPNVKRYYQLKFKFSHNGINFRSMFDIIIVDYEHKIVYPMDLKTSSLQEWNFEEAFLKFHYYTQARLYWRNLRDNMDRDEYFKDFKLCNVRFIVANKFTLTPLVWKFPLSNEIGTLVDAKGREYRDPYDLAEELTEYLNTKPSVPNGISTSGYNTINCLSKINC